MFTRPLAGVLLAAGLATRFGGAKLLAPFPAAADGADAGVPIAVVAWRRLSAALPMTVAVVRPDDTPLADCLRTAGARLVLCPDADAGMGASLACGVRATTTAGGWVIALADMPWISSATIVAVAAALRAGAPLAAPFYRGVRGHPVGLGRSSHAALRHLSGDEGARALLQAQEARLTRIDVDDPGVLRDVDVRADLSPQAGSVGAESGR